MSNMPETVISAPFAGYSSGFGALIGVTGGYLFGYLPLAFCSG